MQFKIQEPFSTKVHITGELYKFVDDETGLFWSGSRMGGFSTEGATYHSLEKANKAWEIYEVFRQSKPVGQILPELTRITYQVSLTEKDRQKFVADGPSIRVTRMNELYGDGVGRFVRNLSESPDFMEFSHILARMPKGNDVRIDLSATPAAVLSSRRTKRRFIAVRSQTDLIYLRMMLGEDLLRIYDLASGEVTYSKNDAR